MRGTRTFDVPAAPEVVFAYLSNPRNLLIANHEGPTVERSTEPVRGVGSWSILAFDQLRVRVEFTAFDSPVRVAVVVEYSGVGSGNRREIADYRIGPGSNGGSVVTVDLESPGLPIPFLGRLVESLAWRRLGQKLMAVS